MEKLSRESGVAELKAVALPWDRVSHAVRHGAASAFITFASRERLGFSEAIGPAIYELGQNPVVRSEASLDQGSIFQVDGLRYCQMVGDDWSTAFYGALGIQSLQRGIQELASTLSTVIVPTCFFTQSRLSLSEWHK